MLPASILCGSKTPPFTLYLHFAVERLWFSGSFPLRRPKGVILHLTLFIVDFCFFGSLLLPRNASIPSTINNNGISSKRRYRPPQPERNLPMTKADLVDKVTALGDLTRRDGEIIVDTLFDAVIGALKSGDKIEIRGFGSFRTRQRNARTGRNPKTGAKVDVPAKRVPFFKPSKELRDSVNPAGAGTSSKGTGGDVDANQIDPHHPPAM
jgi:integration host factor subunit beta